MHACLSITADILDSQLSFCTVVIAVLFRSQLIGLYASAG